MIERNPKLQAHSQHSHSSRNPTMRRDSMTQISEALCGSRRKLYSVQFEGRGCLSCTPVVQACCDHCSQPWRGTCVRLTSQQTTARQHNDKVSLQPFTNMQNTNVQQTFTTNIRRQQRNTKVNGLIILNIFNLKSVLRLFPIGTLKY